MFNLISQKVDTIHKQYNINTFPVPIADIEQIMIDLDYDIVILPDISKACVIGDTIMMPFAETPEYRRLLAHEVGHIFLHDFNSFRQNPFNTRKCECQAEAFAAYFLIEESLFLKDLKCLYDEELAEKYGVPIEFILFRKTLVDHLAAWTVFF